MGVKPHLLGLLGLWSFVGCQGLGLGVRGGRLGVGGRILLAPPCAHRCLIGASKPPSQDRPPHRTSHKNFNSGRQADWLGEKPERRARASCRLACSMRSGSSSDGLLGARMRDFCVSFGALVGFSRGPASAKKAAAGARECQKTSPNHVFCLQATNENFQICCFQPKTTTSRSERHRLAA